MFQQVVEGNQRSLTSVGSYDDRFEEGDDGRLSINMRLIPPGTASGLEQILRRTPGLDLNNLDVTQETSGFLGSGGGTIHIGFRKGLPQLVLIAGVLAIFFVGAIFLLVTSWALFRQAIGKLADHLPEAFDVAKILGIGLIAWAIFGRNKQHG